MNRHHRSIGRRWARVTGPRCRPGTGRPHAFYLAIGFPPAATASARRMRETANQMYAQGWDVTVITSAQESWAHEYGLDPGLSEDVHPAVRIVELPLMREELDTDIRKYSRFRSLDPAAWTARTQLEKLAVFPEPSFGGWAPALVEAILRLHRRDPADLLVATCPPYVSLAAVGALWEKHRVPYVVDLRAGWSIDANSGQVAFPPGSIAGGWERRILESAVETWAVTDPIAEHYRNRYPDVADRVHVVRNGYDDASVPPVTRTPDPDAGLRFGFLGTFGFPVPLLAAVLDGWRAARTDDPLVAGATFELRGHIGAGAAREDNAYAEMLRAAEKDGVRFAGPVPDAQLSDLYGGWDVVVLIAAGGRYATCENLYEAFASGLPVLSAHELDHDAAQVLAQSPLWTGAVGPDVELLAKSFGKAARLAVTATAEDRAATRAAAAGFARAAQLEPAIRRVAAAVRTGHPA